MWAPQFIPSHKWSKDRYFNNRCVKLLLTFPGLHQSARVLLESNIRCTVHLPPPIRVYWPHLLSLCTFFTVWIWRREHQKEGVGSLEFCPCMSCIIWVIMIRRLQASCSSSWNWWGLATHQPRLRSRRKPALSSFHHKPNLGPPPVSSS